MNVNKCLATLLLVFFTLVSYELLAQDREREYGSDGFQWYRLTGGGHEGAQDRYGNTIIPLSRNYQHLYYISCEPPYYPPYFYVEVNGKFGVCTVNGEEIIAPKYVSLNYNKNMGGFIYCDHKMNSNTTLADYTPLGIALDSQGNVVGGYKKGGNTGGSNSYSNSNSSNNTSTSSNTNSGSTLGEAITVGAGILLAGVAIYDALHDDSSNSNKSNFSSNKTPDPERGRREYKNVEIIGVSYTNGTVLGKASATIKVRNKNSYTVIVDVQARFFSNRWEGGRGQVTVPAGEIREVRVWGPTEMKYYDARIVYVE